ncbi:GLPGLI family protein [Chryseobacterium sp. 09-1422]|uniref:GLPGLI family protein n=1 Tax=Chryseobacterium kimseyorum TaxID=2984028 RepID=A0ABT3HTN6_9FLAO|nr:GLPGLI family protein [Chryseobacterium kimseyorum]MCW3167160.1 GLPGLI family protein [Chryseobacterium kimseyorum]
MKTLLITFLSFFSLQFTAQNQRFLYEYKFVKDSTEKSKSETELMVLDAIKTGSKFYSLKKSIADSIHQDRLKKNARDFSGLDYGLVHYVVEKTYPDFQIEFFNVFEMDKYKVTEKRKLAWKILPDKEKIGELNTQKASVNFAGRIWTAWFATDVPIQDGPYKFHGLPGLIVKLEDKTQSHSFVLKEIKKLPIDYQWESDNKIKSFNATISLDEIKYKKQFLDFRNNPAKSLRQIVSSNQKINIIDESGKPLDIEKLIKDKERAAKENNARDNNVLELDLLK